MEGHLLCNEVFPVLSSLSACVIAQTFTYTHTQLPQRGKPGHNMKGHLPPPPPPGLTDGDGQNGSQIKGQYRAIEAGPMGEKRGVRDGEWQRETDGVWFTLLACKTSCDKSSWLALSVLSCMFACGKCCPVRLREQIYTATRWTGKYVWGPRDSRSTAEGEAARGPEKMKMCVDFCEALFDNQYVFRKLNSNRK